MNIPALSFGDRLNRARSSIPRPFRKECLNIFGGTLGPAEAESGLVLEIRYVIHVGKQYLSRNKVPLYIGLYFYKF